MPELEQFVMPYLAVTSAPNWDDALALIKGALPASTSYWYLLETAFDWVLGKDDIKDLPQGGRINRGRIFWNEAELRFRYDASRLKPAYRLVILSDKDLKLPGFTPDSQGLGTANEWERREFQAMLWGEALLESAEDEWFTSRIPRLLKYPGLKPAPDRVPVAQGVQYLQQGRLVFYRFSALEVADKPKKGV